MYKIFIKLILKKKKNCIMSFDDKMASNSPYSSMHNFIWIKIIIESVLEISSFIYYFNVDAFDNNRCNCI